MDYLLTHIQHWLTFRGPPMSLTECIVLVMILLAAAVVFNIVTSTSDPSRMVGNFLFLLAGAGLGGALFPQTLPTVDPTVSFITALFSGMTAAGLVNLALFRSP
jgi:TctA family transporter